MAPSAGEAAYLVLSNLPFLQCVLLAIYYKSKFDAVINMAVFVCSSLYHSCLADLLCVQPLVGARVADYIGVDSLATWWIPLKILPYRDENRAVAWIPLVITYFAVGAKLVDSYVPPALIVSLACVAVGMRFFLYREGVTLPHWTNFLGILVFGGGGLAAFITATDLNSPSYSWSHGTWHILIGEALFFFMLWSYNSNVVELVMRIARDVRKPVVYMVEWRLRARSAPTQRRRKAHTTIGPGF